LAVPSTALSEFAGVEKVWIVRDGQAAEQSVRTGRRDAQRVEILAGLAMGDALVSDSRQGHAGEVVAMRDRATSSPPPSSSPAESAED
jgi:hypothetical protein